MSTDAAPDAPTSAEPLGVVSLTRATLYPVHPSPDPHRKHCGVLREDGTLLESTTQDRHHGEHLYIPPDPAQFDAVDVRPGEAIYGGPLHHVYGHFILESCQRLWWAADHPDIPIVWTADEVTAPELMVWAWDILEILGIGNEIIICTQPTQFDVLHVPDAGYQYADWSHPQQIAFLAAYAGPPQEPGRKLWLSRDPAHGRGLLNRNIIERRLQEQGWTVVTFELMPVRAQLDALARAEVIAGEEASTFHNLLLLQDVRGKRFHVFRRHGPEHRSFTTIGAARDVDQQVHSCSQDAVLHAKGRAVLRLAPNPAQYLSHLGIRIPTRPVIPPDWEPDSTLRRVNRLAGILGAETYLQLGWHSHEAFTETAVAHRDVVADEFTFDVRTFRNLGAHFWEVPLDQFLTWFAQGKVYDLVLLDHQHDWRDALEKIRVVFGSAAHERTVVVLDGVLPGASTPGAPGAADLYRTVLAIHDQHPELDFRTIRDGEHSQTVIWQRPRSVKPRFSGEDEIARVTPAELARYRRLLAVVSEDRAMVDVQDWLSPRPLGRRLLSTVRRVVRRRRRRR